jgi:putative SOS response-associated peptidase YedK
MCGRFTLFVPPKELLELFNLTRVPAEWSPGYNICPSQTIFVIRAAADGFGREGVGMRWGLIPSWAKDESIGNKLANARSETAHEKPSFRSALRKRRCLIPTNGFYEWRSVGGKKRPIFFHFQHRGVFAIAGLYEIWKNAEGVPIESVTLLTTAPNPLVATVHDRMPVILHPDHFDLWLDPSVTDPDALRHLFEPFPADDMAAYEVSNLVNSPKNQGEQLIAPAAPDLSLFS